MLSAHIPFIDAYTCTHLNIHVYGLRTNLKSISNIRTVCFINHREVKHFFLNPSKKQSFSPVLHLDILFALGAFLLPSCPLSLISLTLSFINIQIISTSLSHSSSPSPMSLNSLDVHATCSWSSCYMIMQSIALFTNRMHWLIVFLQIIYILIMCHLIGILFLDRKHTQNNKYLE